MIFTGNGLSAEVLDLIDRSPGGLSVSVDSIFEMARPKVSPDQVSDDELRTLIALRILLRGDAVELGDG